MGNLLWAVRQRGQVLIWGLVGAIVFLVTHWGLVLIPTVLLAVMLMAGKALVGPKFYRNTYWCVRSAWRSWFPGRTHHEDNLDEATDVLILVIWARLCIVHLGKAPGEVGNWMDQNMEYELHEKLTCRGRLNGAAEVVRGVLKRPYSKALIGLKMLEEAEIQGIREGLRLRY